MISLNITIAIEIQYIIFCYQNMRYIQYDKKGSQHLSADVLHSSSHKDFELQPGIGSCPIAAFRRELREREELVQVEGVVEKVELPRTRVFMRF